jgi:hypothetical protein
MVAAEHLREIVDLCGEAKELSEGFIYIPRLRLPAGCQPQETEALLCLVNHNGYLTRLFLSQPVSNRLGGWVAIYTQGRTWHTWSWNGVPAQLRPAEILAEHLRALR